MGMTDSHENPAGATMPNHPEIETVHPDGSVEQLREKVRDLCAKFPDEYWRETDLNRRYPQEFVDTLTSEGLLSALIPGARQGSCRYALTW
jgi:alkylation response protein AidB-like acyl-CoA dehydrogenase